MLKNILFAFLGSGLGGVTRYLFFMIFRNQPSEGFPYKTLIVNVLGSFLIGLFYGLAEENIIKNNKTLIFLATGFCGGFTTFSTFSNDSLMFINQGNYFIFGIYVLANVLLCLIAVYLGYIISGLSK